MQLENLDVFYSPVLFKILKWLSSIFVSWIFTNTSDSKYFTQVKEKVCCHVDLTKIINLASEHLFTLFKV